MLAGRGRTRSGHQNQRPRSTAWVIIPLAVILLLAAGSDYNLLLISRAAVDRLPQDVIGQGLALIEDLVLVPHFTAFWRSERILAAV